MTLTKFIRTLAKSPEWQLKFEMAEKFSSLKFLFNNEDNFSGLQLKLLKWTSLYKVLYEEYAEGAEKLNENVFKSNIRVDAYLVWRRKKNKEAMLEYRAKLRGRKQNRKPVDEGLEFVNLVDDEE